MAKSDSTLPTEYREIPRLPGFRFGSDASISTRWMLGVKKRLGTVWRSLKPSPRPTGYSWFYAGDRKTTKPLRLDEVICEAFHGPRPDGTECVHTDGDRTNCLADNLFWGIDPAHALDESLPFREIPDFDGYRFYGDGTIGSQWATGFTEKTGIWRRLDGIVLDSGHIQVHIKTRDGHRRYGLHHLICWAWHGPCPPGLECRHKDGIPTSNEPGNLHWGSSRDNTRDQIRHGVIARGERNGNATLTEPDILAIRKRYADGESSPQLASEYAVSHPTILRAVRGETWAHLPGAQTIRDEPARSLSDEQVQVVRQRYGAGESATSMAREFGVCVPTITRAITGKTAADLPGALEIRGTGGRVRKLTALQEAELCRLSDEGGWSLQALAEKFGVSRQTVLNILA